VLDAHSFTALLTTWPGYSLIGANLVGLWLMESAFNSAPLHASLPGISAAEPAAGIILGIIVFGDEVRISPVMIAVQAIGIGALVTGVVLVARAPALADLRPAQLAPHFPPRLRLPPVAVLAEPVAALPESPVAVRPEPSAAARPEPPPGPPDGQTARHRASHQE
jgi:hypothetical protein